jgi:hypothetical protein
VNDHIYSISVATTRKKLWSRLKRRCRAAGPAANIYRVPRACPSHSQISWFVSGCGGRACTFFVVWCGVGGGGPPPLQHPLITPQQQKADQPQIDTLKFAINREARPVTELHHNICPALRSACPDALQHRLNRHSSVLLNSNCSNFDELSLRPLHQELNRTLRDRRIPRRGRLGLAPV